MIPPNYTKVALIKNEEEWKIFVKKELNESYTHSNLHEDRIPCSIPMLIYKAIHNLNAFRHTKCPEYPSYIFMAASDIRELLNCNQHISDRI